MPEPYVLGLDLGTNSVGWAMIRLRGDRPAGIIRCGVRIFEAGLEGDVASGRAEPRNLQRRLARQMRRQTERRRRRKRKVFRTLQRAGLLPSGEAGEVLPQLDRDIARALAARAGNEDERRRMAHLVPYLLRARSLTERLEPYWLGRALYQLAQRRGFLSNRKADVRSEEAGKVRNAIGDLSTAIEGSIARTLGGYLATLDPEQDRVRGRWTGRSMYLEEFDRIWDSQTRFHSAILTDQLRAGLHDAIFHQRPLKSVKDLIGPCQFEDRQRRAPWALLEAQRARMLQMVNDTRLVDLETGEDRPLLEDERSKLVERLGIVRELTFAKPRFPQYLIQLTLG